MSSSHRSPPELVKEILLIDDGSDMEHLKGAHIADFFFTTNLNLWNWPKFPKNAVSKLTKIEQKLAKIDHKLTETWSKQFKMDWK